MKTILTTLFITIALLLNAQSFSSHFVTMKDGTKLAVDVHLPKKEVNEKVPALLMFERYWRSSVKKNDTSPPKLFRRAQFFLDSGYAILIVDTRGSGASYGTRAAEYSKQEVMDAGEVLDWVVAQEWSNGNTGSFGTSYTGTTAELLCATQHPSLKAVIPGWSDFDVYRSPVRPYGLLASSFIKKWGMYVRFLDRNRKLILRSSIRPVIKDSLKPALKEHKDNLKVYKGTKEGEFRNSELGEHNYEQCSVVHWEKEIEASNVPMFVLVSWMDAGTAEGAIQRLEHFSNPQKVLILSTAHGGWCHASPFSVSDSLKYPVPRQEIQDQLQLDFFDHHLKGIDKGVDDWPMLYYYNMGEEAFKTSEVWPIPGTNETNFYFHADGRLSKASPKEETGADNYKVDFGVATSKNNRWTTQMEGPVINLDDRGEMDERMLIYTSEPMKEDVQITGTPFVHLQLSSTHDDGAVLVYLEDVDENGKSKYITEGGLRLIHRKKATDEDSTYNLHTFNYEDASTMGKWVMEDVSFKMWPTSVLIKKGHSIRVAIAGADKSTFDRTPKRGTPTLTVQRNAKFQSFVTLPIVQF
jgi:putative CocE/NonD family hydrolase